MKRPILLLLISIITFSIGICFAYINYFKANNQNPFFSSQNFNKTEKPLSDWETLISFENQDLTNLSTEENVKWMGAVDRIFKKTTDLGKISRMSKISNTHGNSYYALIGISNPMMIPGNCGLRIQLFNLQGKHLKSISFNSGWRMDVNDVKVEFIPELNREVIVAQTSRVINGRDVAKQYYGLVNEEIFPIRLENSEGKLIQNIYFASNHTIGQKMSPRLINDWEKNIKSNDIVKILASLVYLGGEHSDRRFEKLLPKISSEAELVDEVRSNQVIKTTILELSNSENKWLRDSANFVLNVKDAEY